MSVTSESLEVRDLVDIVGDVREVAREVPTARAEVLADIICERQDVGQDPIKETAKLTFAECFGNQIELALGPNNKNMLANVRDTEAETPLRGMLEEYTELLRAPAEDQTAVIRDHYAELLRKAEKVQQALG